jgi:hypothetical protein
MGARRGELHYVTDRADNPDIVWVDSLGAWLLGYTAAGNVIRVALLDDSGALLGETHDVGPDPNYGLPSGVALKTGSAMTWDDDDGVWYRKLVWPDVESGPEPSLVLPVTLTHDAQTGSDAAGLDDTVAVVAMDGTAVWSAAVDNRSGEVTAGPTRIGASDLDDRHPGLLAVQERGFFAACWMTGVGPWGDGATDGVRLRLLREDGTPLGAVFDVATDLSRACSCAVGWSGSEFVVIYFVGAEGTVENRMMAQRIRPLI